MSMELLVFKEGMLYLQGVKFGKTTWRKKWAVLLNPSSSGVRCLEMYSDAEKHSLGSLSCTSRLKPPVKKVVHLSDCLSVTFAPKEPCPAGCSAFYINTIKCTYILASMTSQSWLRALCQLAFQKYPGKSDTPNFEEGNTSIVEDNDLYSTWKSLDHFLNTYHVSVVSTEASRRSKLFGDYLIATDREALKLLDAETRHTVCQWPYQSLRKYGQDEGGFSIEAGRRCDSGDGVFSFITLHGPQIFQSISRYCSVEVKAPVQPLSLDKASSKPISSVTHHGAAIQRPSVPPHHNPAHVSADTADESTCYYSTITGCSVHPCEGEPHSSDRKEATREEIEDEDDEEVVYSLETAELENMDDCIYYNLRGETFPLFKNDKFQKEPECSEIYSNVKKVCPPSSPLFQPSPSPPNQCTPLPSISCGPETAACYLSNPQNLHLTPVVNYKQPVYDAQAKAGDDMKETEEAIRSPACVAPTEAPGSFKHRLAEIFSKDLAKFHASLQHSSPTFPKYEG